MDITVPAREGHGEYEEKRSRFIGGVYPVKSESEVSDIIASLKKKYWDARHTVYAFRLADGTARFSDDGEPHGTAGKPVLAVLDGEGYSDCLITVTRYFGGTLLGTGGLVRAYTEAAKAAAADAGKEKLVPLGRWRVDCAYGQYDRLVRELGENGAFDIFAEFGEKVSVTYFAARENDSRLQNALTSVFFGELSPELLDEKTGRDNKNADFQK